MTVKVRFFASMRDRMGRAEESVAIQGATTVAELWKNIAKGTPMPTSMLIAVNMEYTDPNHAVKDGDEVAFFPPVTGG